MRILWINSFPLVEQKPACFTTKGRYNKQLRYLYIIPHKGMNKEMSFKKTSVFIILKHKIHTHIIFPLQFSVGEYDPIH